MPYKDDTMAERNAIETIRHSNAGNERFQRACLLIHARLVNGEQFADIRDETLPEVEEAIRVADYMLRIARSLSA